MVRLGSAALLALATLGCNAILGTQAPLPVGGSGGSGGGTTAATTGSGGSFPVPCGDDEWAHWSPTGTHTFATVHGADGNEAARDLLTGLTWQVPPSPAESAVAWSDASSYCMGVSWASITGYRLPTMVELASLIRYDLAPPAMSSTLMPGVGADYWTSSPSLAQPGAAWVISFGDGTIGWKDMGTTNAVRCVHDDKPPPNAACMRYELVDNSAAVRDLETGLVWQRAQSSGMVSYQGAMMACAGLPLASEKWRLPQVAELVSLLDVKDASPSGLDPQMFPGEPADFYWTATVAAASSNNAWSVDTSTGAVAPGLNSATYYVRCVR